MKQQNTADIQLRVMVIDDQEVMRKIIRRLLREIGINTVETAENGATALEKLRTRLENFPDLIVCDLHMEEMSGTEFVHKLRRSKDVTNSEVPVVILTGESEELVLDVARQVGANAVLQKPVSAQVMRQTIELAVGYQLDTKPTMQVRCSPAKAVYADS